MTPHSLQHTFLERLLPLLSPHSLHDLWRRLLEHLELTFVAVGIAALIGYPLAALVWNRPRWRSLVVGFCNLFQTIPSLALLALLLPLLGLGFLPAVVALTLYAVLPIMRSTITALSDSPDDLLDAGRVMGMNSLQLLWHVRLPQGLPQLISGLRVAFVLSVGTATLSAFIGAGGLGQFITIGLARNDTALLLYGAIPAALLALGIDSLLGQIEIAAQLWKSGQSYQISPRKAACIIGILLALAANLAIFLHQSPTPVENDGRPVIRVGAKNFVEQMILGEIVAQTLEEMGRYRVERKFGLGSTAIIHNAIMAGEIDLYVEYSGTAELNILKLRQASTNDPSHAGLRLLYHGSFGLEWLHSLGFSNSYAVIVRRDGKAGSLTTLSQLVALAPSLKLGLNAEFIDRPDGYPALQKKYGLNFGEVRTLDVGLIYPSLDTGAVDAVVAFATDGRLVSQDYVVLTDDRQVFPRYDAAPVLRTKLITQDPDLLTQLNSALAGRINEVTMRRLNYAVEVEHQEPADVARDFLRSLSEPAPAAPSKPHRKPYVND